MKYFLIWVAAHTIQPPIGPFDNLFACEKAADQVKLVAYPKRSTTVCVNLNAKPHHWNGKAIPK